MSLRESHFYSVVYVIEKLFNLNTKTEEFTEGQYICLDERVEAGDYAIFGVKDGFQDSVTDDETRESLNSNLCTIFPCMFNLNLCLRFLSEYTHRNVTLT